MAEPSGREALQNVLAPAPPETEPQARVHHASDDAREMDGETGCAKRVLFVCNEFPYFLRHRFHIVERLLFEGHEALIATPPHPLTASLTDPRITFIPIPVERHRLSLKTDFGLMSGIIRMMRKLKPDAIHLLTIKPVLFGGLGATWLGRAAAKYRIPVVVTFAGLGRVFDEEGGRRGFRRYLRMVRRQCVVWGLRHVLSSENVSLTFENPADRRYFVRYRFAPAGRCIVLSGAGIDLNQFRFTRHQNVKTTVTFASRLIKPKGVDLFVDAARIINGRRNDIRFLLAGWTEPGRPDGLSEDELNQIRKEPGIEVLGEVSNMPPLLADTDIVVLPSRYREGIPRVLIEGAASGCALIASNRSGCRAIVRDKETGIILKRLHAEDLAVAIERLADAPDRRMRMGAAGRRHVEDNGFSLTSVQDIFLAAYFPDEGQATATAE